MTREQLYDQLRILGVSVLTADALSDVLAEYKERSQDIFILWVRGMKKQDIAKICGVSTNTVARVFGKIKKTLGSNGDFSL